MMVSKILGKDSHHFIDVLYTNFASVRRVYEKVGDEIYRLREEKQKAQLENLGRDELQKRITDMNAFLKEQPIALVQYDESLVRRLIEKSLSTRTNSPWNSSPAWRWM